MFYPLTPVDRVGKHHFKREDLFTPFGSAQLNGGKVRQYLSLFKKNRAHIVNQCDRTVCIVCSVHSPQGYIVARCAASLGLKAVIGIGVISPEEAAQRYRPFRLALELGASVVQLAKIGYNSTLQPRLEQLAQKNGWFVITSENTANHSDNYKQVENLPENLDHLVIPCGSGVGASAVLKGLAKGHGPVPKNIHVVQIAGQTRDMLNETVPHQFVADKTYPYTRKVVRSCGDLELDVIYEAKAFDWMTRNDLKGKTCLWIIGNYNALRG